MQSRYFPFLLGFLLLLILLALANGRWFHQHSLLEQVKADGELVVAMQLAPSAIQHSSTGPIGLEHDLIKAFADELGVNVRLVLARNTSEIHQALAAGQAHMGATRLSTPIEQRRGIRATDPYLHVESQVIYRFGNRKPEKLEELHASGSTIGVKAGSAQAMRLTLLETDIEGLAWEEFDVQTDELLYLVWNGDLTYAVADAHEVLITQRYYPELRVAFTLDDADALAWAFPETQDSTLFDSAQNFLASAQDQDNGLLGQLQEQYYGHLSNFDYVGVRTFLRHITERLPQYRPIFQQAAMENGMDWRLIAALSYQESRWDPQAVSPTGVRGIMMLTLPTAGELGVNRLDPAQSIEGGTRYLRSLRDRLPEHIAEPVRSWLALAAYNVGMGHLQDARTLTQSRGKDPDNWTDIKEHLLLLSDPKWHSKTRFGYARGWEPVTYVTKIRSYYDLLTRVTELPDPGALEDELPGTRTFQELQDLNAPMGITGESAL